jgi:hypothetical protein
MVSEAMTARPQDENLARYWGRRHAEDGYFDWSWPVRRIYNLVRALVAPHPGARANNSEGDGQRFDCWQSPASLAAFKARAFQEIWRIGDLHLRPAPSGFEDDRTKAVGVVRVDLVARDGTRVGAVVLQDIDYWQGRASAYRDGLSGDTQNLRAALEEFARSELGVDVIEWLPA